MKLRKVMIGLLGLASVPFLSGCANSNAGRLPPPVERLTCAAEPAVPEVLTDATVAPWIVALRAAGDDCRSVVFYHRDYWSGVE